MNLLQETRSGTVEYRIARPNAPPAHPVFLVVVDTCLDEDDFAALTSYLTTTLVERLPRACSVGVITFGTMVHLHDLTPSVCPRSFVFRPDKDYTAKAVGEMLDIGTASQHRPGGGFGAQRGNTPAQGRFLAPFDEEVELEFIRIFEDLSRDTWPVKPDHRPLRATGTAISVAVSLLEVSVIARPSFASPA